MGTRPIEEEESSVIRHFGILDDDDIMVSIKAWSEHSDPILSRLCSDFYTRRLGRLIIREKPFDPGWVSEIEGNVARGYGLQPCEASYFVYTGTLSNHAYSGTAEGIRIQIRPGETADILQVSDIENLAGLTTCVEKYYLCAPKTFLER